VPIFRLHKELIFPDPALAHESGILAVGGDLSPERLLLAYASGIFPWFEDDQPILWWSPDPRLVLEPANLHVPRSLAKVQRRGTYEIRWDTAFARVMERCASAPRPDQEGTWITEDMHAAYVRLHEHGWAHSAEAWQDGDLVGGLYGVSLGGAFFGESMFADAPDASKVAFVALVQRLRARGCDLVDCQVTTEHLRRFGAAEIPRAEYLRRLRVSLGRPTQRGPWTESGPPAEGH
jgi:leucyl/phenylalanyl-tRNA--protein transferase